ncbi:SprT-like domain-containing protein [Pseudomonas brenneri]|uniref:SprT-like domain-containing protein n=1 Tax=Pseudomonas brenneri TaxID=129817 RepID=UPI003BA026EF
MGLILRLGGVYETRGDSADDDNGYFFFREISVNPSYLETKHQIFPISVLYHEMAHAYNEVTGSVFKGKTKINDGPKETLKKTSKSGEIRLSHELNG